MLQQFREKREQSCKIRGVVDMKAVIRRAKMKVNKAMVALNHMSPNRNLRHFQEKEEYRQMEAERRFEDAG